jgi:ankyrin repeat protein
LLYKKNIAEKALVLKQSIIEKRIIIENATEAEYKQVIAMLDVMGTNENNILVFDIEDNGISRNEFIKIMETQEESKIKKSDFQFGSYDDYRFTFDQIVIEYAGKGLSACQLYLADYDKKNQYIKTIIDINEANKLDAALKDVANEINNSGLKFSDANNTKQVIIDVLERTISELDEKIQKNSQEIEKHEKEEIKITNDLKNKDTNDLVILWKDAINEERMTFFGWWGKTEKKFIFPKSTKITFNMDHIKVNWNEDQGGKFKREILDPVNGVYEASYESETGKNGHAEVKILIESKNKPDNKIHIEQLNSKKILNKSSMDELLKFNNQLIGQKEGAKRFKNEIEGFSEQDNSDQIIKSLKQFGQNINKQATNELELKCEQEQQMLENIEKKIKEHERWFNLILRIDMFLKYQSDLVKDFVLAYRKYADIKRSHEIAKDPRYIANEQLRGFIDNEVIDVINAEFKNYEKLKKFKENVDQYLSTIRALDANLPLDKYEGYSFLCDAWLQVENTDVARRIRSQYFVLALERLHKVFMDKPDPNPIDKILCKEFSEDYLDVSSTIEVLENYSDYFKKTLMKAGLTQPPHWIVLHKIIQSITNEQQDNDKYFLKVLHEFINLAPTLQVRQKLLLNQNKERKLLQLIFEKPVKLVETLLDTFIEGDSPHLLVLAAFIELKQTNIFKRYFAKNNVNIKSIIDTPTIDDKTLLFLAVQTNNKDLVEYLLTNGSKATTLKFSSSPFYQAVLNGSVEIIRTFMKHKSLVEGILLENDIEKNQNIFHVTFLKDNGRNDEVLSEIWHEVVKEQRKTLMLQKDKNGYTPIHYVAKCDNPKIIEFWCIKMLGRSHKTFTEQDMVYVLNRSENDGNTGLHLAVIFGKVNMVNKIISLPGINLHTRNKKIRHP